jgi:predicted enzyme related to lactoylglutathione lyase
MSDTMKRVTGIGGVFLKARDPKAMNEWYARHLGIPVGQYGAEFHWREADAPEREGTTAWSLFSEESTYFAPSKSQVMINYRVDDLDALLTALKAEGVNIDPKRQDESYGRFAWIFDPEGNKIELWEPPKPSGDQKI